MSKETGGSAFPNPGGEMVLAGSEVYKTGLSSGMTLRDYFAAKCDVSIYSPPASLAEKLGREPTVGELADWVAVLRFVDADAMLAERAK